MTKHRVSKNSFFVGIVMLCIVLVFAAIVIYCGIRIKPDGGLTMIVLYGVSILGLLGVCRNFTSNRFFVSFSIDEKGFVFHTAKNKRVQWDSLNYFGVVRHRSYGSNHHIIYIYGAKQQLSSKELDRFTDKTVFGKENFVFFQFNQSAFNDFVEHLSSHQKRELCDCVESTVSNMTKFEKWLHH